MKGGPRPGSGAQRKPTIEHVLAGTFRRGRHAPTVGATALSPGVPEWSPSPEDCVGLCDAGRRSLERWQSVYTFSPAEGPLILQCAFLETRLADLRRRIADETGDAKARLERLEVAAIGRLASVLLQLHIER